MSDIISGGVNGPGSDLDIADVEPSARVSGSLGQKRERETGGSARQRQSQRHPPVIKENNGGEINQTQDDEESDPPHQVDSLA